MPLNDVLTNTTHTSGCLQVLAEQNLVGLGPVRNQPDDVFGPGRRRRRSFAGRRAAQHLPGPPEPDRPVRQGVGHVEHVAGPHRELAAPVRVAVEPGADEQRVAGARVLVGDRLRQVRPMADEENGGTGVMVALRVRTPANLLLYLTTKKKCKTLLAI